MSSLEEIVVISYGIQMKKDLTRGILNVQADEIAKYKPAVVRIF
ncbi:hypothetical protein WJR50_26040 [Catalinimonas sp. 4WD22]